MRLQQRLNYYRRIFAAYLTPGASQLTFWHESPEINENLRLGELGEYYMPFISKADYSGEYDSAGVPLLNYHGAIGLQYNPIAIAQFGLGNYNLFCRTSDTDRRRKFLIAADWLVDHLEQNSAGLAVWNHHFDFEYRSVLRAPWYSALAQGQGISLLARAYIETKHSSYLESARLAFEPFLRAVDEGGVTDAAENGDTWFEEYVVSPPTHILNGFIWATWGVYDYFLATGEPEAQKLFDGAIKTLAINLHRYDVGFWSLYELSGTRLKMLASRFYHQLHVIQLEISYMITGEKTFHEYAARWDRYQKNPLKRTAALAHKTLFKLTYY